MIKSIFKIITTLALPVVLVVITGCAATVNYIQKPLAENLFRAGDKIETINVVSAAGVKIKEPDKSDISRNIYKQFQYKQESSAVSSNRKIYELDLIITDYALGKSFSWEMVLWAITLLQPMYIEAHVNVFSHPAKEKVAEFDIAKHRKCPANWGMFFCVADVEKGFAEGVVEAVTELDR